MFEIIKEKIKSIYDWTEDKLKRFWKLIVGGIIITAFAATQIPADRNEVSLEKLTQKYEQAIELKTKYQMDNASLIRQDIKNPELDAYKGEPKDEIKITLGDKDKTEFVPNIELKRWNEVSLKIKTDNLLQGVATENKNLSFIGEKIKFDTPKISFEMYDVVEGEGSYKFIWYLNEKPAINKVEFQIESSGLDFFYQPPLTQEYQNGYLEKFQREIVVSETQVKDLEGNVLVERPVDVVGSYAVYHQTKGGMNDIYGKDYKTGQAFFIFRPRIIDAEGKETWGILKIENGIYSVEIPQEFLDSAVYPIRSNDTFGYTTEGASVTQLGENWLHGFRPHTGALGTVNSISMYGRSVTANIKGKFALYVDSNDSLNGYTLENTNLPTTLQWITLNITSGGSINAVDYILTFWGSGGLGFPIAYNTVTGFYRAYLSLTYGTWPDPANWGGKTGSADEEYSIYATYQRDTINITGWETGDLSESVLTSGTISVQSTTKRTGGYALRSNPTTTGAGYALIRRIYSNAITGPDGLINLRTVYPRFYFNYATKPSANDEPIMAAWSVGPSVLKFELRLNSSGNLVAYDASSTSMATGTSVLSADTWYRIEAKIISGTSTAWEVLLDGVSEISGTNNLGTTNFDNLRFGKSDNRNGETVDFFYDDIALNNGKYPGAGQIEAMQIDGDGTYTAWTIGAGAGADWTNIEEIPTDGNTTYLVSTLSVGDASTGSLESAASAGISGTINAVKSYINISRDGATNGTVNLRIYSGTTTDDSWNMTSLGAYSARQNIYLVDPADSLVWTIADLDALEVGIVEADATNKSRLTTAIVMVDFTPAEAAAATPPSGKFQCRTGQCIFNTGIIEIK